MTLKEFYIKFYFQLFRVFKIIIGITLIISILVSSIILLSTKISNSPIHIYAIETGSMIPIIEQGTLIIVKKQEEYRVDDIITFISPYDDGKPITHRIIGIDESDFITKGDNNLEKDSWSTIKRDIIGEVIWQSENLGSVILFMRSTLGIILLYIIPITVLLTLNVQSFYLWLKEKA